MEENNIAIKFQKEKASVALNLVFNANRPEQSSFEHLEWPDFCLQCRLFHLRDEGGHIIGAISGPNKGWLKFLKFDLKKKEFKVVGRVKVSLNYRGAPFIDIPLKLLINENLQCNHTFTLN